MGLPGATSSHFHRDAAGGNARSHGHRRAASRAQLPPNWSLFVRRGRTRKQAAGSKDLLGGWAGRTGRTDGRRGRPCVRAASRQGDRHFPLSAGEALSRGRAPAGIGVQLRGYPGFTGAANVISSNGLEICWGDSSLRSASKGSEHTAAPLPRAALQARGTQEAPTNGPGAWGRNGDPGDSAGLLLPGREEGRQAEPERQRVTLGPYRETWQEPRESERARGGEIPGLEARLTRPRHLPWGGLLGHRGGLESAAVLAGVERIKRPRDDENKNNRSYGNIFPCFKIGRKGLHSLGDSRPLGVSRQGTASGGKRAPELRAERIRTLSMLRGLAMFRPVWGSRAGLAGSPALL